MSDAANRIAPELRVPGLPKSSPLDLSRLKWGRRIMRFWSWLMAFQQPRSERPVKRTVRRTPSADGSASLELRLHRPVGLPVSSPALLWIHGGGYVMGSAGADDWLCTRYAAEANLLVLAVDYRLAPEHPFPAPLDDCHTALVWLHEHAAELGIDPSRIAIGGASAGGGLAAALAQLAQERGRVRPAFQLLNYPMLDDRTVARSEDETIGLGEWVWGPEANRSGWAAYLGAMPAHVARIPARAATLEGLPPCWIGCGSIDLFHPEDRDYAQRLQAAGVPCEWISVDGAYHGFDVAAPRSVASSAYFNSQIDALRRALQA